MPEFKLTQYVPDSSDMAKILGALLSYQDVHNKNHSSLENSQRCLSKIVKTQSLNLTVPGLCQALEVCQVKGKIFICSLLQARVAEIQQSNKAAKNDFYKAINYLLDEYRQTKGKSLQIDFKNSTRQLVSLTYNTFQTELVENLPSSQMSTLFELIQ